MQSVKLLVKIGLAQLEDLLVDIAVTHGHTPVYGFNNSFLWIFLRIQTLSFEFFADQALHAFTEFDAFPEYILKVTDQEG